VVGCMALSAWGPQAASSSTQQNLSSSCLGGISGFTRLLTSNEQCAATGVAWCKAPPCILIHMLPPPPPPCDRHHKPPEYGLHTIGGAPE
jgi:hypothetical protein